MNETEKQVIDLLKERGNLLQRVLTLTENTPLKKGDADKYVSMMDERQKFFDRIYEIDKLVEKQDYNGLMKDGTAEFRRQAEEVFNSSRAIAFRIKERDTANRPMVENIRESFKSEFKTVNEGKSIRNLYSDSSKLSDGHYFNKTK